MIMSNNKGRNTSCLKASFPGLLSQLIILSVIDHEGLGTRKLGIVSFPGLYESSCFCHIVSLKVSRQSEVTLHAMQHT